MSSIKITADNIEDVIIDEQYMQMGIKTVVCLLTLKNGFEIVGNGSCVDPENFDWELGKKVARNRAKEQIWMLEGYRLQCENPME